MHATFVYGPSQLDIAYIPIISQCKHHMEWLIDIGLAAAWHSTCASGLVLALTSPVVVLLEWGRKVRYWWPRRLRDELISTVIYCCIFFLSCFKPKISIYNLNTNCHCHMCIKIKTINSELCINTRESLIFQNKKVHYHWVPLPLPHPQLYFLCS